MVLSRRDINLVHTSFKIHFIVLQGIGGFRVLHDKTAPLHDRGLDVLILSKYMQCVPRSYCYSDGFWLSPSDSATKASVESILEMCRIESTARHTVDVRVELSSRKKTSMRDTK